MDYPLHFCDTSMTQLSSLSGDSIDLDEGFDLESYDTNVEDSKHFRYSMHESLDQKEGSLMIRLRSDKLTISFRSQAKVLQDSCGDFELLSVSTDASSLSEDEFTYETVYEDSATTFLTVELENIDSDLESDYDSDDEILSMDTPARHVPIVCEQSKSELQMGPERLRSAHLETRNDINTTKCARLNELRMKRKTSARKLSTIMGEIEQSESMADFGKTLKGTRLLLLSPAQEPSTRQKTLGELRLQRLKSQRKLINAFETAHIKTEPTPTGPQVCTSARSA